MQSTNIRQVKAALVEQVFHGTTQVGCPLGSVVAVSRWKGQLRVMIRGWGRWHPVEHVSIERICVAIRVENKVELSPCCGRNLHRYPGEQAAWRRDL